MDRAQKTAALFVLWASLLFSIGGLCVKLIPWSALAINGARNLIGSGVIGLYLLAALGAVIVVVSIVGYNLKKARTGAE